MVPRKSGVAPPPPHAAGRPLGANPLAQLGRLSQTDSAGARSGPEVEE